MFTSQAEFLEFVKVVAPKTVLSVPEQIVMYREDYYDRYKDSPLEIIKWVRGWDPEPSVAVLTAQQELRAKRKACIRKLIEAYDQWVDAEDEIFSDQLDDDAEADALDDCRQEFLDVCAEVFVA